MHYFSKNDILLYQINNINKIILSFFYFIVFFLICIIYPTWHTVSTITALIKAVVGPYLRLEVPNSNCILFSTELS